MNKHLQESLLLQLEVDLSSTYRKLVSSRYFSPAHLEALSHEAKMTVENQNREHRLLSYMIFIQFIYNKAKTEERFDLYERRIGHFFEAVSSYITDLLKEQTGSKQERAYAKLLFTRLKQTATQPFSPYPQLMLRSLPVLSAGSLESLDRLFQDRFDLNHSKETAIAISYFYLFIGKESVALKELNNFSKILLPHEIEQHIKLMAKRERFTQIIQWIGILFERSSKKLGSLQQYADQAETALQSASIHFGSWDRWLHAPSIKRFNSLIAPLSSDQVEAVLSYILPKLADLLHTDAAKLAYVQLLHQYSYYVEARDYFLTAEPNPISMQEPKIRLLKTLAQQEPTLALPVYHQFIVRLVEKRSRKHYVEAADYTMELKSIYSALGQQDIYVYFTQELKRSYKSYRAFIEELKRRET